MLCYKIKVLNQDYYLQKKEREIVAGVIFTITIHIMQCHLAGTANAYLNERPVKLTIDEADYWEMH